MSHLIEKFREEEKLARLTEKVENEGETTALTGLTSEERKRISDEIIKEEGLEDKIRKITRSAIYFKRPSFGSAFKNFKDLIPKLKRAALRTYIEAKTGKGIGELSRDEIEEQVDLGKEIRLYSAPDWIKVEVLGSSIYVVDRPSRNMGWEFYCRSPNRIPCIWCAAADPRKGLEGPAKEVYDRLFEVSKENLKV